MHDKPTLKVVLKRKAPTTANERVALAQRLTSEYTKKVELQTNSSVPDSYSPEQFLRIARLNLERALDGLTGWGVLLVNPISAARLCKAAEGLLSVTPLNQWMGQPNCLLTTQGEDSLSILQRVPKKRVLVLLTPDKYRKFVSKLNEANKYIVDFTKPESEDPAFRLFFL